MDSMGSISLWLHQLKAGERASAQKLWERYFQRLVGLARAHAAKARPAADAEDVALSAFDSFFRAAKEGRFPRLEDRDDLWQVLALLAGRKAINLIKQESAQKRGGGKAVHASALEDDEALFFHQTIGAEPDPAFVAEVSEQCQRLLAKLGDDQLRQIALWKLEGLSNEEIAKGIGRSVPTVERKLKMIRDCWQDEAPAARE